MQKWILNLIILAVSLTSYAQGSGSRYKPYHLYRVELNGIVSWVYGTIHVAGFEVSDIQGLPEVIGSVGKVLVETLPGSGNPELGEIAFEEGAFNNTPLEKLLAQNPLQRFKLFLAKRNPNREFQAAVLKVHPGYAAFLILDELGKEVSRRVGEQNSKMAGLNGNPKELAIPIDFKIVRQSLGLGIPVESLDSAQLELRHFLNRFDIKKLNAFILENLTKDGEFINFEQGKSFDLRPQLKNFLLGKLEAGTPQSILGDLLETRDFWWREKILAEMHARSTLVAVGVAHLHHSSGLLGFLRQSGAKITPATKIVNTCRFILGSL